MATFDACPGFLTDINATFNVPTSLKIPTCSRLLWGPRSWSVASTFRFSMHELSGCCDSHSDHLHHCLLGSALTCRIASAYFLSYRACDYIKLWPDAGELLWVYLLQLQLTCSTAYSTDPGHKNRFFDPASECLSTHWWSQNPACQRSQASNH